MTPQDPQERTLGSGKLTYEDLLTLTDESKRYEILDGELAVTPSPATKHQRVSAKLSTILCTYVWQHRLGEVLYAPMDVILDAHTVVEPDILFVAAARAHILQPHAIVGAPDLAIEILSPTTSRRDKGIKATLYARFGVEHYWLVDPVEELLETFHVPDSTTPVRVYEPLGRHAGNVVVTSSLFPGLVLDLARVWE
jgi:Uma2 family endonuclease